MNFLPLLTAVLAFVFFGILLGKYFNNSRTGYFLWLALGLAAYGAGTFAEAYHRMTSFDVFIFKLWYISGAIVGGWALVTGMLYHILHRKTAAFLLVAGWGMMLFLIVTAILSPVTTQAHGERLSSSVFQWSFIRPVSTVFHLYSFILLAGVALYAAFQYSKSVRFKQRFLGMLLITSGGLLPALGRSHSTMDISLSFYMTELLGLIFIFGGCLLLHYDKAPAPNRLELDVQ